MNDAVMSQPAPAATLPPLFGRVTLLDAAVHAQLRLDRTTGLGFAAGANAVPLTLAELPYAARHFPIVFADGPQPMPLAILGYRNGENLFVSPEGKWRPGVYLPAYFRAFPFLLVQVEESNLLHLAIEPDAPSLQAGTGEPLFEAGQPSPFLKEMMAFCTDLRSGLLATQRFGEALRLAGLLEKQEARVEFRSGGSARLDGFQIIDAGRFEALPDETFLAWRRERWLDAAYAVLQSQPGWSNLLDLA